MAYDYFATQPEEDKNNPNQALSQASSVVTGSGAPAGGSTAPGKGTSSGQFTNLQSYLDANKGTGFGQKAAGDAQSTVDQANSSIDSADRGFRQKVDQGAVSEDSDLISKAKSNPTAVDSDAFAKQRDAKYQGPQNLSDTDADYMKAYSAQDKAKQLGEQTKTEGGRKAWLADQYGQNSGRYDYTSGQQNLDNLILQNDPGSQQAFQGVQQNAAGAGNRFSALQGQLNSYAQQRAGDTAKTSADARAAIGLDSSGNFTPDSDLQKILAQADTQSQQYNQNMGTRNTQIQGDFQNGKISPDEYALLGADANSRNYRVDPTQFLRTGQQATKDSVLSAEQQAKIAALSKLGGRENTYAPNAALAGTYDPAKANYFDQTGYSSAVNDAKGTYEKQLGDTQSELKQLMDEMAKGSTGMSISAINDRNARATDALRREQQLANDYSGQLGGGHTYDPIVVPDAGPNGAIASPNYQNLPPGQTVTKRR